MIGQQIRKITPEARLLLQRAAELGIPFDAIQAVEKEGEVTSGNYLLHRTGRETFTIMDVQKHCYPAHQLLCWDNPGIVLKNCTPEKCASCGFNPEVAERRKKETRIKLLRFWIIDTKRIS